MRRVRTFSSLVRSGVASARSLESCQRASWQRLGTTRTTFPEPASCSLCDLTVGTRFCGFGKDRRHEGATAVLGNPGRLQEKGGGRSLSALPPLKQTAGPRGFRAPLRDPGSSVIAWPGRGTSCPACGAGGQHCGDGD